jgi:hypothetical protein
LSGSQKRYYANSQKPEYLWHNGIIESVAARDQIDPGRFSFLLADLINLVQNKSANFGDFQYPNRFSPLNGRKQNEKQGPDF